MYVHVVCWEPVFFGRDLQSGSPPGVCESDRLKPGELEYREMKLTQRETAEVAASFSLKDLESQVKFQNLKMHTIILSSEF
jgi:hypothetical protein